MTLIHFGFAEPVIKPISIETLLYKQETSGIYQVKGKVIKYNIITPYEEVDPERGLKWGKEFGCFEMEGVVKQEQSVLPFRYAAFELLRCREEKRDVLDQDESKRESYVRNLFAASRRLYHHFLASLEEQNSILQLEGRIDREQPQVFHAGRILLEGKTHRIKHGYLQESGCNCA